MDAPGFDLLSAIPPTGIAACLKPGGAPTHNDIA
jgi:hypothetical protein